MNNQQWNQQGATPYSNPYSQQQQQGPYQNRAPQQQQGFGQGYGQQAVPVQQSQNYNANAYRAPYANQQPQQQYQQPPQTQVYGGYGQQAPQQQPRYDAPPTQVPYQQPAPYSQFGSAPYQQPPVQQQPQQAPYDAYNTYQRQSPAPTQPSPYSAMNMQMNRAPVQTQPQTFKQNYDQPSQYYGNDNNRYQRRSPSPKRNNFQRGGGRDNRDNRDSHRQVRKRSVERHFSPPKKQDNFNKRGREKEERSPYIVRFNTGPWNTKERQYTEVKRRYPNLHVVADFTKVVNHWTENTNIELDHPIQFECDNETGVLDKSSISEPASLVHGTKHNGKIMLMSGVDWTAFVQALHDHPDDPDRHLNHLLRFLVAKKDRSSLMCIGGSWSQKVDGGDPLQDESVLLRTALRCGKEFCGVDLSDCKSWIKFMEIWYHRPAETIEERSFPEMEERTTIFIPDVWNAVPSGDLWASHWDAYQERISRLPEEEKATKEDVPQKPHLIVSTQHDKLQQNIKCTTITLDGLLDYNIEDRLEKTFEVSLFAEAFSEYLQIRFGKLILSTLREYEKLHKEGLIKGTSKPENDSDERDAKRIRLSEVSLTLSSTNILGE